ncbi:MAG: flagellar basal body-associated FliL family protein [Rhodospirillales bacterium]
MTLLPDEIDDSEADDDGVAAAKPRPNRRKLILIVAGAAVVLLVAGGVAAFMLGLLPGETGSTSTETASHLPTFYALPDLVVTLNTGDRRIRYLKTRASLELTSASDVAQIDLLLPRVIDYCQTYLRELRPDELRGSAAIVRMRDELLTRINLAVAPVVVREILFTDLMVE